MAGQPVRVKDMLSKVIPVRVALHERVSFIHAATENGVITCMQRHWCMMHQAPKLQAGMALTQLHHKLAANHSL
jgi:hypothetical protein